MALPFVASQDEARRLLGRLDGLVLTGSEDLDSALWGEPLHPQAQLMHPARHASELALCRAVVERPLPTLAICGGMQTLAVAGGGTIHQHLPDLGPDVLDHADATRERRHPVETTGGSRLRDLLGPACAVNTVHHQAVRELGPRMTATAHCSDGVLEAYEMPDEAFVVGVQWHPEHMLGEARQERLFRSLVVACGD